MACIGQPLSTSLRIESRPCSSQLQLLLRRLLRFDASHYDRTQTGTCDRAVQGLLEQVGEKPYRQALQTLAPPTTFAPTPGLSSSSTVTTAPQLSAIPGSAACRQYWLFPLLVTDPENAIVELNRLGVDAYRGATQLSLVPQPPELKSSIDETVCVQIIDILFILISRSLMQRSS